MRNNMTTSNEMTSSPEASDDVTYEIFDSVLNRLIPSILSVVCFIGLFGNFIVVYIMRKVYWFLYKNSYKKMFLKSFFENVLICYVKHQLRHWIYFKLKNIFVKYLE